MNGSTTNIKCNREIKKPENMNGSTTIKSN